MSRDEEYDVRDEFKSYLDNIKDEQIKHYIDKRVLEQINWYNKRSLVNQRIYRNFMIISIIMSGSIPVLTLLLELKCGFLFKVLIAILSSSITVISSAIAFFNYRELWITYRTNCELLKSTLHKFFNRNSEFKGLNDNDIYYKLVEYCEVYITKEFQSWETLKMNQSELSNE